MRILPEDGRDHPVSIRERQLAINQKQGNGAARAVPCDTLAACAVILHPSKRKLVDILAPSAFSRMPEAMCPSIWAIYKKI